MAKKPNVLKRVASQIAHTNLSQIGSGLVNLTYKMVREHAIEDMAKSLGTTPDNMVSIIHRLHQKEYRDIGRTEIVSAMGDRFADQPQENLMTLATLYETHPWVFVCASYISTQLAGIPLRIMRATGFEKGREVLEDADDSPVGRMFRWMNPFQSPFEVVEAFTAWHVLCGEAYLAMVPPDPGAPAGIPHEVYPLFSPFVKKIVSPFKGIVGYEYNVGGQIAYFDRDEVIYFGSFSPAGRFTGQGQAAAGIRTIQTDNELREFNRRVLSQGVHISGVLESENIDLDGDEAAAIRDGFEKRYAGSGKAGRIAVLWGGVKFNPTTILQKDVMMDTQLQTNRDEIIALYGLKPELLTEKFANKATAETVRRMALEDTIMGRYGRRYASVLSSTGLMRYDPDLRAIFDTRDVPSLQSSQKEKAEVGEILVRSGQYTANEVRTRIHGLDPIDGSEADILMIGGQPAANQIPGGGGGEGEGEASKLLLPAGTHAQRVIKSYADANIVVKAPADDSFNLVISRTRTTAQNRLEKNLRSIYRDIQKEVRTLASRSTLNSNAIPEIERIMLFDGRSAVSKEVADAIRAAGREAIEKNVVALKIEGLFDIKPTRSLGRLAQQEQRVRNMMGRQWVDMRKSLYEGVQNGETAEEMARRVDRFFDGAKNNAATVARTEINPAINGGSMDFAVAAKELGVNVRSEWVTSQSERVRRRPRDEFDHMKAHGLQIIPGEEMFQVSGEKLEYPGDSWNGASPGNTINCECGIKNLVLDPE